MVVCRYQPEELVALPRFDRLLLKPLCNMFAQLVAMLLHR
jgi:hypothetical protein